MKQKSLDWDAIIARVSSETAPVAADAPFGLATRVVTAWRIAQRDEGLRRWTRWSLRAALGSVAVCVLIIALGSREEATPILLPPPSHDFVTPTFFSP
jgi:hypothetical protein